MSRKGPDGKDLPPLDDESTEEATRRMPKRSIRDRIASADDEGAPTQPGQLPDGTEAAADTPDVGNYAETQLAGGTAPVLRVDAGADTGTDDTAPTYAGDTVEQTTDGPDTDDETPDGGDGLESEITQVYRPKGKAEGEEGEEADEADDSGLVPDPVCGWLVVVEGPGLGSAVTVGYGNNRVGRDAGEDIVLDFGDGQISRENHAVVTYDGKNRRFYVQQGGGRNLTHVNEELVLTPVEISGGESVQMGETKLKFVPLCGSDFDWYDE
jgi:hypothetical protein